MVSMICTTCRVNFVVLVTDQNQQIALVIKSDEQVIKDQQLQTPIAEPEISKRERKSPPPKEVDGKIYPAASLEEYKEKKYEVPKDDKEKKDKKDKKHKKDDDEDQDEDKKEKKDKKDKKHRKDDDGEKKEKKKPVDPNEPPQLVDLNPNLTPRVFLDVEVEVKNEIEVEGRPSKPPKESKPAKDNNERKHGEKSREKEAAKPVEQVAKPV